MKKYKPLIISGPSGSGKTYLMKLLVDKYGFKNVLSTMTRPKREGEIHMIDNEYISKEQFEKDLEENKFIFNMEAFGEKYAYRKEFIEKIERENLIPAIIMFTPYINLFTEKYSDTYRIFLLPKNTNLIEERMRKRGDSEESIEKRINSAKEEIEFFKKSAQQTYHKVFEIEKDSDVNKVIKSILDFYKIEIN